MQKARRISDGLRGFSWWWRLTPTGCSAARVRAPPTRRAVMVHVVVAAAVHDTRIVVESTAEVKFGPQERANDPVNPRPGYTKQTSGVLTKLRCARGQDGGECPADPGEWPSITHKSG